MGIEYGSELSLDIDKDIVDAVNARQAVLEWSMILTARDKTSLQRTCLPPLEKCWSAYVSLSSKNPILPQLKDPRKWTVCSAISLPDHGQEMDKQQSPKADAESLCMTHYTDLITISENVLYGIQQPRSADAESCLKLDSEMRELELYRMFDWSDRRWSDVNAARSLMQLRYGISWNRTP